MNLARLRRIPRQCSHLRHRWQSATSSTNCTNSLHSANSISPSSHNTHLLLSRPWRQQVACITHLTSKRHHSDSSTSKTSVSTAKLLKKRLSSQKSSSVTDADIIEILYKNVWPHTREGRLRSGGAISLMFLSKLTNLAVPFAFKGLIDSFSVSTASAASAASAASSAGAASAVAATGLSASTLATIPLGFVLAYGVGRSAAAIFRESQNAIFAHVTMHGTRSTAVSMFEHLHRLDLEFHINKQTGLLSKAIDRGVRGITYICNTMLLNVVPTIFEVSLVCGVLGYNFGTPYAMTTGATLFTYVLWTLIVTQRRTRLRQSMNKLDNESSSHVIDSLMNFETVKYFNNEEYESAKYSKIMDKYKHAAIKVQTSLSALNAGQHFIFSSGLTVMMYLACGDIVSGAMTLGDLVMVNTLLFQLSVPLNFIGSVYREVKLALTDLETMVDLLKKDSRQLHDSKKSLPNLVVHSQSPSIVFDNVSFAYPQEAIASDGKGSSLSTYGLPSQSSSDASANGLETSLDRPLLSNLSFEVPAGGKFAIVGGSGCGKSTILRLLYRFYNVSQGKILIDNQDISCFDIDSVRKSVGVVPQDIVLFNDTLLHNIGYGNINASMDDIIEVSKKAKLHDFIVSLPNQYDTMCGERGLKLSGGEKQRVAIARMLLKDSNIVVCDEATSALDSRTEADIMQSIKQVTKNKTTIFVAHRLSTIMDSDVICVMKNGKIVEMGNHYELISMEGTYANMWKLQSSMHGV